MIELAVVIWLCIRNAREARDSGHSPVGYVFMTIGLWFGMEIIGVLLGLIAGGGTGSYGVGLLLAAAGGFISYKITSNLRVIEPSAAGPLIEPAKITIVRRESSALNVFAEWYVFLNGVNIGSIGNDAPITIETNQRENVLTARGPGGAESPRYVFTAGSGFHMEVLFNGGRFGNAHRTDA